MDASAGLMDPRQPVAAQKSPGTTNVQAADPATALELSNRTHRSVIRRNSTLS